MNYLKIQQEFLKDTFKNKEVGKKVNHKVGSDTKHIFLTCNGYIVYRIPKSEFYLDYEKLKEDFGELGKGFVNNLIDIESNPAVKSDNMKMIKSGRKNIQCVYIENEDTKVLVDEKLLKHFNNDCTFAITKPNAPVFVLEYEKLVGVVLPIKVM